MARPGAGRRDHVRVLCPGRREVSTTSCTETLSGLGTGVGGGGGAQQVPRAAARASAVGGGGGSWLGHSCCEAISGRQPRAFCGASSHGGKQQQCGGARRQQQQLRLFPSWLLTQLWGGSSLQRSAHQRRGPLACIDLGGSGTHMRVGGASGGGLAAPAQRRRRGHGAVRMWVCGAALQRAAGAAAAAATAAAEAAAAAAAATAAMAAAAAGGARASGMGGGRLLGCHGAGPPATLRHARHGSPAGQSSAAAQPSRGPPSAQLSSRLQEAGPGGRRACGLPSRVRLPLRWRHALLCGIFGFQPRWLRR